MFTKDLKNFSNEPQKMLDMTEVRVSARKMRRPHTTKFFYPKNGLYGLL
jgi:hypothetical protein